jgi:RNA polymerase subunit RPABC4/transcription elongation factor Spt4
VVFLEQKSGCLVCGRDLIYLDVPEEMACSSCGRVLSTSAKCPERHFVCDDCHRLTAEDFIGKACLSTEIADPLELAIFLMRHPGVKMHGPEHHFLVPAVLLTGYSIATGRREALEGWLKKARDRAHQVKGGSCGLLGDCGAAVGTGIFMSVVSGATPLSKEEWRLSNLMTSMSLHDIALAGGPRCCKRNTYLAILAATSFVAEHLGVIIPVRREIVCGFSDMNRECRRRDCPFYREGAIPTK